MRSVISQSLIVVRESQYGHVNLPTSCLDIVVFLAGSTNVTLLLHSEHLIEHDISYGISRCFTIDSVTAWIGSVSVTLLVSFMLLVIIFIVLIS